jgi:endonuclease-3
MNQQQRIEFFTRLKANNPKPTTELEYCSNFELLVAVILSAQATDVSVNKATRVLFKKANTPEKIAKLGESGLKKYIQSIGLFNSKAKNIIKTCEILIEKFDGLVPDNREDLTSLPGVGRKTANVILNTAFGHDTIAVDTHIFRVSNRTGLAKGKTPLDVELKLIKAVPAEFRHDAHHWLILHGRYICTARNPKCLQCPVNDLCAYFKENS